MILFTKMYLIFDQKPLISASLAIELIEYAPAALPAFTIRVFIALVHVLARALIQHILLIDVIRPT